MKKESVFKILKIFICALLSVVFVLGVVAVPFYYSITALTKPETVAMVIQEVDYKKVIQKNPTIKKTLAKYGITPIEADTVMKSKQTGELVEVYANEVTQIFLDIPDNKMLDVPYIKEIVHQNTEKFIDIAEQNTSWKFKKSKAKATVDAFFEKNEVAIEESVEVLEEVRDVVKTIHTSRVVEKKLSLWIAIAFIAAAFVIIAVIIVLMRSNGFFWVAADFAAISIILCLVIAFSKSDPISRLALKISDFGTQIVESAISISTEKMIIAVFGTVIMTVLFMGFFAALKFLKQKYQTGAYISLPVENKEEI